MQVVGTRLSSSITRAGALKPLIVALFARQGHDAAAIRQLQAEGVLDHGRHHIAERRIDARHFAEQLFATGERRRWADAREPGTFTARSVARSGVTSLSRLA